MPRQQVYGKRARTAAYDTFAAFADSPRASNNVDLDCSSLVGAVSSLKLDQGASQKETAAKRQRKALSERNANCVVQPKKIPAQEGKVKPRHRRRKVVESSDEEHHDDKEQNDPEFDILTDELGRLKVIGDQEDATVETVPVAKSKPQRRDKKQDDSQTKDDTTKLQPELIADEHQAELPLPTTEIETETDVYSTHCASILSLADHPLTSCDEWADQLAEHFTVSKIAEASFGEVYRLSLVHDLENISPADESVFKVIPLRGPEELLPTAKRKRNAALRKAEGMSKPADVANEVQLLQRMSCIPGFTNFRDVRVLRGRPAPVLAKAFHSWNASQKERKKELSHFPDPSKKSSYEDDQLWAVIEMQNAGNDLERFVEVGACANIWAVWDIFWQVVISLAKGEEGAEFEHRDLHLGNVCVRRRPKASSEEQQEDAADEDFHEHETIDMNRNLNFTPLETTIIDYTLSRASMLNGTAPAFYDLSPISEGAVFEGDSSEEYQYDIYRYMRSAMFLDDPLAEYSDEAAATMAAEAENSTPKTWETYDPITNLVWLHFLLYKLLDQQFKWPSETRKPAKKKIAELARWNRARELEERLVYVQELLDPEVGLCKNGLRSAGDIVALAIGEAWLDIEDVVGGSIIEEECETEDELTVHFDQLGLSDEVKVLTRRTQ